MRKSSYITVTALALIGSITIAAPPPIKKTPSFNDDGATLTAAGNLKGIAAGTYEVKLLATGTESVVCGEGGVNPPAQPLVLTGTKVVSVSGDANVVATFEDLVSSAPPAPACAQSEDVAVAVQQDVAFTNAVLEIRPAQADPAAAPKKPVRCIQCSFTQPTVDGPAKPQSCLTMFSC
ncbi:hypothetical protein [Nannocystis pusilla]|uniref:Uncharacterized protein n=1 Tax=Nannocystis pusilla TaxID=889268 RepID=A0ABS7TJJ8_9BACT|nr:hypothetical protein [Nannocystis pusilla]MBZ5708396.1 hypothetical protein [Nannocystis pusilla]